MLFNRKHAFFCFFVNFPCYSMGSLHFVNFPCYSMGIWGSKTFKGGDVRTDVRNGSPLCPTGHRPFGAAAQKERRRKKELSPNASFPCLLQSKCMPCFESNYAWHCNQVGATLFINQDWFIKCWSWKRAPKSWMSCVNIDYINTKRSFYQLSADPESAERKSLLWFPRTISNWFIIE